ncbi:DUF2442 domain-containing protein [Thiomicrorhabdus cannonii]|uniref:DUF2442 domain-containing protein n=1 Tax=Thiomicrorhabdus cannonii TaxID=2748011 RepID=UPI0015BBE7D3|nr:DUF2442 domain-containing protein [Thiomicrorhabdus cannonii]
MLPPNELQNLISKGFNKVTDTPEAKKRSALLKKIQGLRQEHANNTSVNQITNVEVRGSRALFVLFNDGVSGFVEFEESFLDGILFKLKGNDKEIFNSVQIAEGWLAWPGEIFFDPDKIHDEIQQNGNIVLT